MRISYQLSNMLSSNKNAVYGKNIRWTYRQKKKDGSR